MSFSKSLKSSSIKQSAHSERTGDLMPQKPRLEFSDFGDGACGEPAFAQHIVLDFTPDAKIDNEISQQKICDFWKFISNSPSIKNLMVKPERCAITKPSAAAEAAPEVVKEEPEENVVSMAKTAFSMLEIVEEKELITRAFEGKMPQSYCSLGSREYKENEDIRQKKRANHIPIICRCTKICKPCPGKKPPGAALSKAKQLCTKLHEWDDKHPKSMEPPSHPPALQHCIIQRQVFDS